MKHLLALLAICITTLGYASAPVALADAPQPGTLEIALTKSTITLGEPLILKYRVSNPEDQRVRVSIDNDLSRWLTIKMNDTAGHAVRGALTVSEAARHHVTTSPAAFRSVRRTITKVFWSSAQVSGPLSQVGINLTLRRI